MELEILGSGTSHGIPVIGCQCPVCASSDPRDNRTRASAIVRCDDGKAILIDAGPEFRVQALRARLSRLDAVLITHSHADHIHGLDDVRIFTTRADMPVYAETACIEEIRERFAYIFRPTQEGGGKPHLELIPVSVEDRLAPAEGEVREIEVAGVSVMPIPLFHGSIPVLGWRIGDTAYLTDCNMIPEASFALLSGTRNLVIDALRAREHSTHFSFQAAIRQIERIGPEHAWFTHICHDFSHKGLEEWLLENNHSGKKIEPAHDGLRITIR
jgi:phosphoribosyl 1,2-cyclic phosphate phosphodiesterase